MFLNKSVIVLFEKAISPVRVTSLNVTAAGYKTGYHFACRAGPLLVPTSTHGNYAINNTLLGYNIRKPTPGKGQIHFLFYLLNSILTDRQPIAMPPAFYKI